MEQRTAELLADGDGGASRAIPSRSGHRAVLTSPVNAPSTASLSLAISCRY